MKKRYLPRRCNFLNGDFSNFYGVKPPIAEKWKNLMVKVNIKQTT
jgi:hypothetical protein